MFDSISDAIIFTNTEREILLVNPAFTTTFGYEAEEIKGRTTEFLYADSRDYEERGRRGYHSGESVGGSLYETTYRRKDGSLFAAESLGTQVKGSQGKVIGLLGVHRDITERKQLEEERARTETQLRQAQKMEAIGLLAGGIAHDFNNILGAIIGYSELALYSIPDKRDLKGDLRQILSAGLRAKELVKQILTFSRQTEREPAPVELTYIVKEAVKMLRAMLPSTISITEKVVVSTLSRIMADPTEIHQIVMNLCTSEEVHKGRGRILFVDDEETLVILGKRMLERLGYSVTTRTNSREALEVVKSMPYWFDLVITDYTMPHMTGLILAKEAKTIRPDLPVIILSGHNEKINPETASSFGIEAFIAKPVDMKAFSRVVKQVLGK
jgi:PAS domain S-box-containing protein